MHKRAEKTSIKSVAKHAPTWASICLSILTVTVILGGVPRSATAQGVKLVGDTRVMADVTGDGRADVVGFGVDGVWVSKNTVNGFEDGTRWIKDYHGNAKWTPDKYVRTLADVNGDGKADIVAFGYSAVLVSLSSGTSFGPQGIWYSGDFCSTKGWDVNKHRRQLHDVDGDGYRDIIAARDGNIYWAKNNYNPTTGQTGFGTKQILASDLYKEEDLSLPSHDLTFGEFDGDGKADVIYFAPNSVYLYQQSQTGFRAIQTIPFGQGWKKSTLPRMVADVNNDGKDDIIGFAESGVWVHILGGTGMQNWVANYGSGPNAGGWDSSRHFRTMADLNNDGCADVIGFGEQSVFVSVNNFLTGHFSFSDPVGGLRDYTVEQGWRFQNTVKKGVSNTADSTTDDRFPKSYQVKRDLLATDAVGDQGSEGACVAFAVTSTLASSVINSQTIGGRKLNVRDFPASGTNILDPYWLYMQRGHSGSGWNNKHALEVAKRVTIPFKYGSHADKDGTQKYGIRVFEYKSIQARKYYNNETFEPTTPDTPGAFEGRNLARFLLSTDQPLVTRFDYYNDFNRVTKAGKIYPGPGSGAKGLSYGHAVMLTGYSVEGNPNYWVCQNSWGKQYGRDGDFLIAAGACGIDYEIFYINKWQVCDREGNIVADPASILRDVLYEGKITKDFSSEQIQRGATVTDQRRLDDLARFYHEVYDVRNSLAIKLQNTTKYKLVNPEVYHSSGTTPFIPKEIAPGRAKVIGARKAALAATGAVGVVTYEMQGTAFRLAIFYEVPYTGENKFKVQIITKETPTNSALHKDMSANPGRLTLGNFATAFSTFEDENGDANQGFRWSNFIKMTGVITRGKKADLDVIIGPKS